MTIWTKNNTTFETNLLEEIDVRYQHYHKSQNRFEYDPQNLEKQI